MIIPEKLEEVELLPTTIPGVIEFFNREHCVTHESSRVFVIRKVFDSVLQRYVYHRFFPREFRLLWQSLKIIVGAKRNGDPIYRAAADIWLESEEQRKYRGGVTFDPTGRCDGGKLNLWTGMAYKPEAGDCELFKEFIFDVIVGRDNVKYDYLMNYLARMVQFPDELGEVAIVVKSSEEGTGKTTFAKTIAKLLGQHALHISNSVHLTGRFNSHLQDCILLHVSEAFFAGNPAHAGILKSLITDDFLTIEQKYGNIFAVKNRLHIIMTTNNEWAVPASLTARRFFVLGASNDFINNYGYFTKIFNQMENGGYAALLHELLNRDISEFNPRDVPHTIELSEQKKHSLQTHEKWWLEILSRGYVWESKFGLEDIFMSWLNEVSTELLYNSYLVYAAKVYERHKLSREFLGNELKKFGCKKFRLTRGIVGERVVNSVPETIKMSRPHGFQLGNLLSAREDFEKYIGLSFGWDESGDS